MKLRFSYVCTTQAKLGAERCVGYEISSIACSRTDRSSPWHPCGTLEANIGPPALLDFSAARLLGGNGPSRAP